MLKNFKRDELIILGMATKMQKKLGLSQNLTCKIILGKYLPLQYTKENEGDQELDMQVLGGTMCYCNVKSP
jgi:hypothetical protein